MGGKNKNKDVTATSSTSEDNGATGNVSIDSSTSTNDVLIQMLQQQQQQFAQQQQQFMQQHQQMTQILASISAGQQGTTTTSTPPTTSMPKAQVHSPDKLRLDFSLRGAQEWKSKWNDYAILTDMSKLPQPKQFAALRLSLDDEVLRVLDHTLGVKTDSVLPVEDIIDKIITHIKDKRNESLRRLEFTNCKQHQGETFENFWVRLKQVADDIDLCKGDNCVDNQLKHAIHIII